MPFLVTYIIKFSISLAVVYIFYQLVLRRLTFYNWNRMYLLSYTMICFFIPFIDISGALHQNKLAESEMINWLPLFQLNNANVTQETGLTTWNIISLLIVIGIVFMTIRFIVQLLSFQKLMKKATLISENGIKLYQVDEEIIPFSFGNAVFINKKLHNETELQEIIRHELVHVKQRHSFDIIWSEILCMLNWFNPFAWLIRKAIRQNLEFLADNKVLDNGIDRKQYQYLLLKVIGNNHFSIAPKFNFSSLKKRVAMMNKLKSTKLNLLRFLFVLPLIAVILVSFRQEIGDTLNMKTKVAVNTPLVITDTVPIVKTFTDKEYFIYVMKNEESPLIIVKDKNKKEVTRLTIKEWSEKEKYYEGLYGKLPPPPPPAPPAPPSPVKLPENVSSVKISNDVAIVILKDGAKERFDLNDKNAKQVFEKKYGKIPPPPPPAPPAPPSNGLEEVVSNLKNNNEKINATQNDSENNNNNVPAIYVKGKSPLIVIDGEVVSQEEMAKLDKETIQSVDVLKDKSATDKYGDKGKDGVIVIKTKSKNLQQSNPLFVLDGEILTNGEINQLNPNNFESMNVLKGKSATDAYGDKGKNGVIVIKTKAVDGKKVNPLFVLDGKVISNEELNKLNPDSIEVVNVLKGKTATDMYQEKGKDGVVIITSKKDKE